MPVYYDKARARWRYEFSRIVGGRRRRATKLLPQAWNRAQADAYAHTQDAALYAATTGGSRERHLIAGAVAAYLQEHAPGLKNRDRLERALALTQPWYQGRTLGELADVARRFTAEHTGKLAPATIRLRMAYLRAACRWAWKHRGMGEHDPAERLAMPAVRNERHVYLDRAQLLDLARTITHREARAVVLVLYYSGMRLAESLRAKPTERGWLLTDTKNGERRLVPIHPKVAYLARRWPPIVPARTVQTWFLWASRTLGHADLRLHDLRHTSAAAMINAGVPLYTVGAVLGHKSAQSTKRYAHLDVTSLADAVGRIGKRR